MAKELPYFKFEPSEWIAKDIQDCSLRAQGAFINICSYYWLRLGDLKYATALRRHCENDESVIHELLDCQAIKVDDGFIFIDFLNKQLEEFKNISAKNSENARKRWDRSKKNAVASVSQSDRNAIREEEKKEEEKKEDIIKVEKFSFKESLLSHGFDKDLIDDWLKVRRTKKASNTETALKAFLNEVKKSGSDKNEILKFCVERDWKGFKVEWLENEKNKSNGQTVSKTPRRDAVIDRILGLSSQ